MSTFIPVEKLRVGDMVDLCGDPYTDPKCDNVIYEFEYVVVGDPEGKSPGELETRSCYRLEHSGGACGFPPGHKIRRVNTNRIAK